MSLQISVRCFIQRLRTWARGDEGVSAVEFALFAPVLVFALLATVDVGLAVQQRMTLDHVLRAGAQSAISDAGEERVREILESTATKHFLLSSEAGSAGDEPVSLTVIRYFACPGYPEAAVASSTMCADNAAPYIYYRLSGEKAYSGLFLPISLGPLNLGPLTLSSSAQVQIR